MWQPFNETSRVVQEKGRKMRNSIENVRLVFKAVFIPIEKCKYIMPIRLCVCMAVILCCGIIGAVSFGDMAEKVAAWNIDFINDSVSPSANICIVLMVIIVIVTIMYREILRQKMDYEFACRYREFTEEKIPYCLDEWFSGRRYGELLESITRYVDIAAYYTGNLIQSIIGRFISLAGMLLTICVLDFRFGIFLTIISLIAVWAQVYAGKKLQLKRPNIGEELTGLKNNMTPSLCMAYFTSFMPVVYIVAWGTIQLNNGYISVRTLAASFALIVPIISYIFGACWNIADAINQRQCLLVALLIWRLDGNQDKQYKEDTYNLVMGVEKDKTAFDVIKEYEKRVKH